MDGAGIAWGRRARPGNLHSYAAMQPSKRFDGRLIQWRYICATAGFYEDGLLPPLTDVEFCGDDFHECLFAISGAAAGEQVHFAVVWGNSGGLDDLHAVLPVGP